MPVANALQGVAKTRRRVRAHFGTSPERKLRAPTLSCRALPKDALLRRKPRGFIPAIAASGTTHDSRADRADPYFANACGEDELKRVVGPFEAAHRAQSDLEPFALALDKTLVPAC